ncbi:YjcZ family sporulation protein [Thermaerobacillus caldiproteolyticus]|nr:YjcZ family sporulation protein [Anoxybacillus caldiproteolyticus]
MAGNRFSLIVVLFILLIIVRWIRLLM